MKKPTNWYAVALSILWSWPVWAALGFGEILRRGMGLPWYAVPALIAAFAGLAGIVLGYTLLEDWLRYESDEWQRRRN